MDLDDMADAGKKGKTLWMKGAAAALAGGAALSYFHSRTHGAGAGLDLSVYVILSLAAGWLGAAAGGAAAWLRYGRSPLEPLFRDRFGWHYRRRYWLRFAMVFASGWLAFIVLCIAVALGAGAYEEVLPFFTPKGMLVVALFVLVFGAEGALVGGIIDLLRFLGRRQKPGA